MNFWKVSLLASVLLLCVNVLSADATTITFQNGLNGYSGTQDTYIDKSNPGQNYGGYNPVYVYHHSENERRILINFINIFGPGANQIKAGSSILSATLRFLYGSSYPCVINTHLVTTSWDESVTTWDLFGGGGGGVAGTDWELPEISATTLATSSGPFDFNVASAVSAWSSGTVNNGLILLGVSGYSAWFFSEDTWESYKPLLIVEYEENAVPEPLSIILLGLGLGISWFRKKFRNR